MIVDSAAVMCKYITLESLIGSDFAFQRTLAMPGDAFSYLSVESWAVPASEWVETRPLIQLLYAEEIPLVRTKYVDT
jgi:hypothetical protein